MSYFLCPKLLAILFSSGEKKTLSFFAIVFRVYFFGSGDSCRDCVKKLREDFKLKCGACYLDEAFKEYAFRWNCIKDQIETLNKNIK